MAEKWDWSLVEMKEQELVHNWEQLTVYMLVVTMVLKLGIQWAELMVFPLAMLMVEMMVT